MYQVAIKADPDHFLHWDKPLSEQSEHVQKALASIETSVPVNKNDPTGQYFNSTIADNAADRARKLRDAGIPGIKYMDQGSRGIVTLPDEIARSEKFIAQTNAQLPQIKKLGDQAYRNAADNIASEQRKIEAWKKQIEQGGSHNYVVFDDKTIDILKKYGLAGLGLGLGAKAASKSDTGMNSGGFVRSPALAAAYRVKRAQASA